MAWSHFFLNCGDRKSLKTVSPGRRGCVPPWPPHRRDGVAFPSCSAHLPSSVQSSSLLPLPARPTFRETRGASGVSAKRPGHLSWQLHGNPGASAVWSPLFPLANHGDSSPSSNPSSFPVPQNPVHHADAKFDLLGAISRELSPPPVTTPLQGWQGEGHLALWREIRVMPSSLSSMSRRDLFILPVNLPRWSESLVGLLPLGTIISTGQGTVSQFFLYGSPPL